MKTNKEIALELRNHVENCKILKVLGNSNYLTKETYEKFYYGTKEDRGNHIKRMINEGWKYEKKYSKYQEALYVDWTGVTYDETKNVYVLCAEFFKEIK